MKKTDMFKECSGTFNRQVLIAAYIDMGSFYVPQVYLMNPEKMACSYTVLFFVAVLAISIFPKTLKNKGTMGKSSILRKCGCLHGWLINGRPIAHIPPSWHLDHD